VRRVHIRVYTVRGVTETEGRKEGMFFFFSFVPLFPVRPFFSLSEQFCVCFALLYFSNTFKRKERKQERYPGETPTAIPTDICPFLPPPCWPRCKLPPLLRHSFNHFSKRLRPIWAESSRVKMKGKKKKKGLGR
jgi:hypothetical protein